MAEPSATPDAPDLAAVQAAAERLRGLVHRTPVLRSRTLDAAVGAELHFKCENLQRAGAFKFRGACNALLASDPAVLGRGVATHSSGNHAAALALAARIRGVRATIVMPRDAPEVKKRAVAAYGAEIVFCEPSLASRESTLAAVVAAGGQHVVHPYDDARVIAGQGTAALELLDEGDRLDTLLVPVGGGGLAAGTALAARASAPAPAVFAAEPEEADDAWRSLRCGRIVPVGPTQTIADGLRTSLGTRNFAVLRAHGVRVVRVSEAAIVEAMRLLWERLKVVVEPSGAVPLAALLEDRAAVAGSRIGIVLSGGNVDLDRLPWAR